MRQQTRDGCRPAQIENIKRQSLDNLVETVSSFDKMETVRKMKQIVPEYKSNNSVYEVLDNVGLGVMVK